MAVVLAERAQVLADYIDHHHPKLGSRLMALRFGGLRTTEPTAGLVAAVLGAGTSFGVGARQVVRRTTGGRLRPPLLPTGALGAATAWLALWRWDSVRWRRSHVMVVVDLPEERLDGLVEDLVAQGLEVQRWDRPRRADGPNRGLTCRLRDLRQVNAAIDDASTGATR